MAWDPEPVFARLRNMLKKHAGRCSIAADTTQRFGLQAPIGPATLKAWKGKARSRVIAVAWVEIGKTYVSYHLMGVYMNPKLLKGVSTALLKRMQGKSCFNFKSVDEELFEELERLTAAAIDGMRTNDYIVLEGR